MDPGIHNDITAYPIIPNMNLPNITFKPNISLFPNKTKESSAKRPFELLMLGLRNIGM